MQNKEIMQYHSLTNLILVMICDITGLKTPSIICCILDLQFSPNIHVQTLHNCSIKTPFMLRFLNVRVVVKCHKLRLQVGGSRL